MKHTKVFVTNITKDINTDIGYGVWLHHVVSDCTTENGLTEIQTYRIFSKKEYEDVINKGYYEIEDNDLKYKKKKILNVSLSIIIWIIAVVIMSFACRYEILILGIFSSFFACCSGWLMSIALSKQKLN